METLELHYSRFRLDDEEFYEFCIDPFNQTVYIYRADGSIQINRSFDAPLSGEDVLSGLEFDLSELKG